MFGVSGSLWISLLNRISDLNEARIDDLKREDKSKFACSLFLIKTLLVMVFFELATAVVYLGFIAKSLSIVSSRFICVKNGNSTH